MQPAARVYVREFGLAMALYVVVLLGSVRALQSLEPGPLRIAVTLLPMLPVALALMAYLRFLRRMDELQLRIQLEGIGFAAGAVGLLTFAYGFLENVGLPAFPVIWVFPLLIAFWGIGTGIAARHYR
ncbi:MAG: hypothetical protein E6I87_14950 [Chloroflexi bacterium]|nr:MAG: hypothetical protein E6I87_14950 [Chloroflexota bacterium]